MPQFIRKKGVYAPTLTRFCTRYYVSKSSSPHSILLRMVTPFMAKITHTDILRDFDRADLIIHITCATRDKHTSWHTYHERITPYFRRYYDFVTQYNSNKKHTTCKYK